MASATGKTLRVVVVTPEKAVLDTTADMVIVPLYDGEFGVQPGHSAFVGQLGPGELRIKTGADTKHLFVDGGFVQVRADVVNVLTQFARKSEELTEAMVTAERTKADAQPAANMAEKATKEKLTARAKGLAKLRAKATTA